MMYFNTKQIYDYLNEQEFKLVDIKEIEHLSYQNTIELNSNKYTLENFLSLARQEGKYFIFFKEVVFEPNKFHISESKAIDYLQEKYNITLTRGLPRYGLLSNHLREYNGRLFLHDMPEKEVVSLTLTFIADDTQYIMSFQEKWYERLLETHPTVEELVDLYVKENPPLLKEEV
ncbi:MULTISPECIES: hypothetical protein [unclassified Bacillus cereus group]|uniref:hypothetical protein n=1 Tax=unclassified Bacillus cereus group TaxID=2750818 RepID=UPI0029C34970|nr:MULTISPECIES: hypothetical protein [unclassified Bacillus cereus group]MDX5880820.1 hypothetical protein [Bacillus cereus group sp. BfR-BA-01042]MDX5906664.1 hypothetical protein [Bacillus cereus group sp. BfR-BA-01048]